MDAPIDDPSMEETQAFWQHATPQQLVMLTRLNELTAQVLEIQELLDHKDKRIDELLDRIQKLKAKEC